TLIGQSVSFCTEIKWTRETPSLQKFAEVCLATMRMGGQARSLEADVGDVRLASLYLPNGTPVPSDNFDYKLRWFERFNAYAKTLAGRDVFLCGDFNVVPTNEDIYNAGSWRFDAVLQPETSGACKRLLAQGWTDTARYIHP